MNKTTYLYRGVIGIILFSFSFIFLFSALTATEVTTDKAGAKTKKHIKKKHKKSKSKAKKKKKKKKIKIKTANKNIDNKPNIIFILTDDLDESSFTKETMPNTFKFLKNEGTTFKRMVIPMPTCCPSRSNFLSGQYNHNNNVLQNSTLYGGYPSYYREQRENGITHGYNIGTFMQNGGYKTAFMGKYLNTYGDEYVPNKPGTAPALIDGWDEWFVPVQNNTQKYYNYTVRFNSSPEDFKPMIYPDNPKKSNKYLTIDKVNQMAHYGAPKCKVKTPTNYYCSKNVKKIQSLMYAENVFTNRTIEFLKNQDNARSSSYRKPVFIWYAADTPHGTSDHTIPNHKLSRGGGSYLPEDSQKFKSLRLRKSLSFNEKDVSDKPTNIKAMPLLDNNQIESIRQRQISRWRSMYSLDRNLNRVYEYLKKSGKDKNTILIFTSDNGFMTGQHRVQMGKFIPYKEVTEFPIIFKGPGISSRKTVKTLAVNIDLVPTVLDLAGLEESVVYDRSSNNRMPFDGMSLKPYMISGQRSPASQRDYALLESTVNLTGYPYQSYKGVVSDDYVYIRYYKDSNYNTLFNCPVLAGCVNGEEELYNLRADPYQINNLVPEIEANRGNDSWATSNIMTLRAYYINQNKLNELEKCSGSSCLR